MRVFKNKFKLFLSLLLLFNVKLFCGIQVSLPNHNIYFSKKVLLEGLRVLKIQLSFTRRCLHQKSSFDLLCRRQQCEKLITQEFSWKDSKSKYDLLDFSSKKIDNFILTVQENESCVLVSTFEFLAKILCVMASMLPDFNSKLKDSDEIFNKYDFGAIISNQKELTVDFKRCCKIIDRLFEINKNLLISVISFLDQKDLLENYPDCLSKDRGWFQNAFMQGFLHKFETKGYLIVCDFR